MNDNFEDKIIRECGICIIPKGQKLYFLMNNDSTNIPLFYFQMSETNVRRLNYLYEERYEVVEDISLPVLFSVSDNYNLVSRRKLSFELHEKRILLKDGWITTTPTCQGLQLNILNSYKYLKKIEEKKNITYGWLVKNNISYPNYLEKTNIQFILNISMKNNIEYYINKMKTDNWENSFIDIINNNPIKYVSF